MRNSEPLPSTAKASPSPDTGRRAGDLQCHATRHEHHAQRGDKRRQAHARDAQAVDRAAHRADHDAKQHADGTGMPAFTASAATTPDSARTEPTDRSMPPVMITQVAPTPR